MAFGARARGPNECAADRRGLPGLLGGLDTAGLHPMSAAARHRPARAWPGAGDMAAAAADFHTAASWEHRVSMDVAAHVPAGQFPASGQQGRPSCLRGVLAQASRVLCMRPSGLRAQAPRRGPGEAVPSPSPRVGPGALGEKESTERSRDGHSPGSTVRPPALAAWPRTHACTPYRVGGHQLASLGMRLDSWRAGRPGPCTYARWALESARAAAGAAARLIGHTAPLPAPLHAHPGRMLLRMAEPSVRSAGLFFARAFPGGQRSWRVYVALTLARRAQSRG